MLLEILRKMTKVPDTKSKYGLKRKMSSQIGNAVQGTAASRVKFFLEHVSKAEYILNEARESVRLAYYRLGQAYFEWVSELQPALDESIISRKFHHHAYPLVRTHLVKLFGQKIESATTKRLERVD